MALDYSALQQAQTQTPATFNSQGVQTNTQQTTQAYNQAQQPQTQQPQMPLQQPTQQPQQPQMQQPIQPPQIQGSGLQMPTNAQLPNQQNPQFDQQGLLVPGTGGLPAPVNFDNLQKAFQSASGPVPQTQGQASSAIQGLLGNSGNSTFNTNAINFLNTNPTIQNAIAQVQQYLQPTNTLPQLQSQLNQVQTDQNVLWGLNLQMMNLQNVMNGTTSDIRQEVQAAGGFATESQVTALATARNKTLLQQSSLLQNQINGATEAVKNDQNLLDEERSIANDQFSQNSTILNAAQKLQDQITTAQKDGMDTIIKAVGINGLVQGLMNADPTGAQLASAAKILGMTPQQLQQTANQEYYKNNLAQINAAGITSPYAVNSNGEVWNSQTGEAYTSQADFQAKTGMDINTANQKGLISSLTSGLAQKNAMALEQQNLNLTKTQAEINSSNASAASSGTSAAKNAYELQYEQQHGGMTPQAYTAQQDAIQTNENTINNDAAILIGKLTAKTNPISWNDAWNTLHAQHPDLTTQAIDNLLQSQNYRR